MSDDNGEAPPDRAAILAIRDKIDAIDARVLDLLDERAALAIEVGHIKRSLTLPLRDPEREQALLDRLEKALEARGQTRFPPRSIRAVYREIVSACLSLEQPIRVAYLAPPGTFTHMAARTAFGLSAHYVEAATVASVFDAVTAGDVNFGVVPLENSTEGGVTHTLDALLESTLLIRQELVLDITHCLLAQSSDLTTISRVYSHPQALAQCRGWLARNLPGAQLVVSNSTSAAALQAVSDPQGAAIASRLAAELHGLEVVRTDIQDRRENRTRFIVIATQDAPETGDDITTFVFSAPHQKGALREVLSLLEDEGLNLSRIESRPSREEIWQYVFFTDVDCHRSNPAFQRAVERLGAHCERVKVLGSYPRSR